MIDAGRYNLDHKLYSELVEALYAKYPEGVTLPPEYASFVEGNLLHLLIRLARYKFVARMIKPHDDVLEIGCGSGLGSIFLGQFARTVEGIDVKATEIDEARRLNRRQNVCFAVRDFFEREHSAKHSVIVALDVIEHLHPEQGRDFVARIAERLAPDGMAVIGTPSIYSYPYQGPLSKASHVKCYDQHELLDLVDRFFGRSIAFSMNDEMVHTGYAKMAWYYFAVCFGTKAGAHGMEPTV